MKIFYKQFEMVITEGEDGFFRNDATNHKMKITYIGAPRKVLKDVIFEMVERIEKESNYCHRLCDGNCPKNKLCHMLEDYNDPDRWRYSEI